jgi:hypothetical protein
MNAGESRRGNTVESRSIKVVAFKWTGCGQLEDQTEFRRCYDEASDAVTFGSKIKLSPGAGLSISIRWAKVSGHFV